MSLRNGRFAAMLLSAVVGLYTVGATAQERPYTEGAIVNVAGIRTNYGMFDEYMKFLATTWKQEQEAAKKAGLILSYEVLTVEPRGENDADVYLVVTYENWAALDGLADRSEAIAKQVYGSTSAANQGVLDRAKMRRVHVLSL